MHEFDILTRRSFFGRTLKLSMGIALSTLVDIPWVMKRALAEGSIGLNGKKVLFIFLRGANDGLNSVIPILDSAYQTSRPTGGSNIGMSHVARSDADGYTLLLATSAYSVNPGLYETLPYDPFKDFTPICELVNAPNVLVVNPGVKANSLAELVRLTLIADGIRIAKRSARE